MINTIPIKTLEILQRHISGTDKRIDRSHLSIEQKEEILQLIDEGYLMKKTISEMYGVVQQTISYLIKNYKKY